MRVCYCQALAKAKIKAQGIQCLNNNRQLIVASITYGDDFNGIWIPNEPGPTGNQIDWVTLTMNWSAGNTDNTNINKLIDSSYAKLAAYIRSPGIYHCPGDPSNVPGEGKRVRSVSASQAVGSVWFAITCLNPNDPVNGQWLTGSDIGGACQPTVPGRSYGKGTIRFPSSPGHR